MARYLAVCLSPTLQRTIVLHSFRENEVNRSSEHYLDAAGKGVNVARVLTQLGQSAVHLTHAGGRDRELLLGLARSTGVDVRAIESPAEIRTCYTLVDSSSHTTTEIVEEAPGVPPETEERIHALYTELLDEHDVVIIGGTKSPGFSDALYPSMTREAKRRGLGVILDIRGPDLLNSLEYGPDVIKPNLAEFAGTFAMGTAATTGAGQAVPISEHTQDAQLLDAVIRQMELIHSRHGTVTVLTRGGNETLFWNGTDAGREPPGHLVPVNTIGCGDAFTAGFAVAWAARNPLAEAVRAGHAAAAQNALRIRPGTLK